MTPRDRVLGMCGAMSALPGLILPIPARWVCSGLDRARRIPRTRHARVQLPGQPACAGRHAFVRLAGDGRLGVLLFSKGCGQVGRPRFATNAAWRRLECRPERCVPEGEALPPAWRMTPAVLWDEWLRGAPWVKPMPCACMPARRAGCGTQVPIPLACFWSGRSVPPMAGKGRCLPRQRPWQAGGTLKRPRWCLGPG